MIAERMPSASEQQALYSTVFTEAGDRPVTFRTFDIGGDKIPPTCNPSRRRTRPSAGAPSASGSTARLLRAQPRSSALPPDASQDHVPDGGDLRRVRARQTYCGAEKAHLANHSHPLPSDLKLGVMLEVPSLLFQLKEICESADFISLGTNDLMQFLLPATARTGAWRTASIP